MFVNCSISSAIRSCRSKTIECIPKGFMGIRGRQRRNVLPRRGNLRHTVQVITAESKLLYKGGRDPKVR